MKQNPTGTSSVFTWLFPLSPCSVCLSVTKHLRLFFRVQVLLAPAMCLTKRWVIRIVRDDEQKHWRHERRLTHERQMCVPAGGEYDPPPPTPFTSSASLIAKVRSLIYSKHFIRVRVRVRVGGGTQNYTLDGTSWQRVRSVLSRQPTSPGCGRKWRSQADTRRTRAVTRAQEQTLDAKERSHKTS